MIDWAAIGQMVSGIGTLAGAIAIIVAAIVGRDVVASFRRQKQVERQIEHAERALTTSYQLKEAIGVIRSPLSTSHELASSREELETTDWFSNLENDEKSRTVQANVFYQRIRSFEDTYSSALSAYFGKEAEEAFRKLIKARHTVRVYADAFSKDSRADRAFSRTIESYVWEGAVLEGEDPVNSQVTNAIEVLERHLLPVIREGSSDQKAIKANA